MELARQLSAALQARDWSSVRDVVKVLRRGPMTTSWLLLQDKKGKVIRSNVKVAIDNVHRAHPAVDVKIRWRETEDGLCIGIAEGQWYEDVKATSATKGLLKSARYYLQAIADAGGSDAWETTDVRVLIKRIDAELED